MMTTHHYVGRKVSKKIILLLSDERTSHIAHWARVKVRVKSLPLSLRVQILPILQALGETSTITLSCQKIPVTVKYKFTYLL